MPSKSEVCLAMLCFLWSSWKKRLLVYFYFFELIIKSSYRAALYIRIIDISMLSQNPSGVLPDMWYVSLVWLLDSFSSQSKAWSCKFTGILERVEEVGLGLKIRKCDSCCCCTILPHLSVPSDYYVSSMLWPGSKGTTLTLTLTLFRLQQKQV